MSFGYDGSLATNLSYSHALIKGFSSGLAGETFTVDSVIYTVDHVVAVGYGDELSDGAGTTYSNKKEYQAIAVNSVSASSCATLVVPATIDMNLAVKDIIES